MSQQLSYLRTSSIVFVPIILYKNRYWISSADLKFFIGHNNQFIAYLRNHVEHDCIYDRQVLRRVYESLIDECIPKGEEKLHGVFKPSGLNNGLLLFNLKEFLLFMQNNIDVLINYVSEEDFLVYKLFYSFDNDNVDSNVFNRDNYPLYIDLDDRPPAVWHRIENYNEPKDSYVLRMM
ncbi:hypothetical protein ABK040_007745 [Willaertia magna]